MRSGGPSTDVAAAKASELVNELFAGRLVLHELKSAVAIRSSIDIRPNICRAAGQVCLENSEHAHDECGIASVLLIERAHRTAGAFRAVEKLPVQ